jgi:hypothetical protein
MHCCPRDDLQSTDRRDACECLAAEAERADIPQTTFVAEFAGCVSCKRQGEVAWIDAMTVVSNTDKFEAAATDLDGNAGCAGVNRVFSEFLDGGSRSFDDLPSGYERD